MPEKKSINIRTPRLITIGAKGDSIKRIDAKNLSRNVFNRLANLEYIF